MEIVLCFVANVITIFNETVLKIEGDKTAATEIYKAMSTLKDKIERRLEDGFFGFATSQKLASQPEGMKQRLKAQFVSFYQESIRYLEKSFDFSNDNILAVISPMAIIDSLPTYDQLCGISDSLGLTNVDLDELYEEVCTLSTVENTIPTLGGTVYNRWQALLSRHSCPNINNIVAFVLSIPSSNAGAERVFSGMNAKWTDTRNRATVELIKAELMVAHNYHESCQEMYKAVLNNAALQKQLKAVSKYDF